MGLHIDELISQLLDLAKKLITVLEMTKITTLAKSKETIFLLAPIILIIGSNLNLLPYYSFCIFA